MTMVCDASWLCSAHAPFRVTPSPSFRLKRARIPEERVSCCSSSTDPAVKKREWHNPGARRSLFFRRRWVEVDTLSSVDSADKFLVVSYNILGDDNASKHVDLYSHIPLHFMKWDWRKRLIFQELSGWNPDIVCLQEVDRFDDFLSNMKREGYIGSFKRRTGEAMDGCAMFWKENTFHLLEGECIEFKGFGLRDNVAQLFVFEMNRADSRRLLVGNVHVLFNPNRGDIKLGQIRLFLRKAHELSEKWGGIPVVLAGDFNSTPQSAIYKFFSTSELNIMKHDRRNLSGQNWCHPAQFIGMPSQIRKSYSFRDRFMKYYWPDEEVVTASGSSRCTKLEHPFKLCSSYARVKGKARTRDSHGEPLATTYHSKFLGTVDYIWYSDGLVPTRVLDTLSIDILRRIGGLPSKVMGSDHLPLVSEFAFIHCNTEEEEKEESNTTKTTNSMSQRT